MVLAPELVCARVRFVVLGLRGFSGVKVAGRCGRVDRALAVNGHSHDSVAPIHSDFPVLNAHACVRVCVCVCACAAYALAPVTLSLL